MNLLRTSFTPIHAYRGARSHAFRWRYAPYALSVSRIVSQSASSALGPQAADREQACLPRRSHH